MNFRQQANPKIMAIVQIMASLTNFNLVWVTYHHVKTLLSLIARTTEMHQWLHNFVCNPYRA